MDNLEKKALAYHEADGVPGKISVVPTKPCRIRLRPMLRIYWFLV